MMHICNGCHLSSEGWLLAWTCLGTVALAVSHDAIPGGRDWDLLSFPAPYVALLGVQLLQGSRSASILRAVRLAVVPTMVLHTALFIGIATRSEAAMERQGHLMRHSNMAAHYLEFQMGYHHLTVDVDPGRARLHLQRAIELAPTDTTRTRRLPLLRSVVYSRRPCCCRLSGLRHDQCCRESMVWTCLKPAPGWDEYT